VILQARQALHPQLNAHQQGAARFKRRRHIVGIHHVQEGDNAARRVFAVTLGKPGNRLNGGAEEFDRDGLSVAFGEVGHGAS